MLLIHARHQFVRACCIRKGRGSARAGWVEIAHAAREVILADGAVGSPHLLQLSGVGNPDDLAKASIPMRHPLPGVGHNFQDHYIARMSCEVRGIETLNERGRGLSFASELWRYVTTGTGMLTYSASLCAASVKVLEESATPDVQCVFAPASYKPGLIRKLDDTPGITGGPWQMRPLSRGYVLARTPAPHDRRRSTRVISPRTRTAARWSAVSNSCVGCSRRPQWRSTWWPRSCRAPASRAMTSCWIMPGRTARRSTTLAAAA